MNITENGVKWFSQIIQQQVSADISLGILPYENNGEQLAIKHGSETLKIDNDDIHAMFDIQKLATPRDAKEGLSEILFLIFRSLTRQEEYESSQTDFHDRFPAVASMYYQEKTLEYPVVDECFEVIRQAVLKQWPHLKLTQTTPKTIVTCDVDNPYEAYVKSLPKLLYRLSGDGLKRCSMSEIKQTARNYYKTLQKDYSFDPNSTFDWMMDVNEKVGNKIAFYLLVDQSVPKYDGHYSINEPRIRKLMRRIHERGHEIGLHASYGTYKEPTQVKKEVDKLRQVMSEENIKQDEIGSRQHYLRWSSPETARYLEAAGISYDTTLGYADHAGFRCGTCHEYPMFDFEEDKPLNIRQRPLIVMEGSVIHEQYMNLGYSDEALNYMKRLKDKCYESGGNFTLLWHNSHFRNEKDRVFYQELISHIVQQ